MTAEPAIQKSQSDSGEENPLQTLSELFREDMKQVNGLILKRLDSDVALIPQIAQYLIMAGGKRIRPLLTLASTRIFDCESDRPYKLAAAVEFIHTATLLHDDVVDESPERRGQKAAPEVFGNQASVLVGDFLFSRSFQLMVEDGSLEILRILSQASAIIAEGEVMQLQTTNNIETTLEEYKKVIGAKTAALFAAACEIGPVIAERNEDEQEALRLYGYNLGMAFQIADDVLDYNADRVKLGKAIGDDFKEGKMTAPVILAIQKATDEERSFWQRTLQDKDQTDTDLETALELMQKYNTIKTSLTLAYQYAETAIQSLSLLEDSQVKSLLINLVDYTIKRET